ncbi:MAG: hypothetical protein J1F31_06325 [Erysipelotrichales bacterium]|nr:hypothetical protein [Erysipelotrichales bacterium]
MLNEEIDHTLSKDEVQNILNCFTVPSLPFLLALINSCGWNIAMKILVIAIPFCIQFIMFFICDYKIKNSDTKLIVKSETNIISKAIISTTKTIILMSGSIILFSLISYPLSLFLSGSILILAKGIFEFSYPLSYLFSSYSRENLFFIIGIISFSSISLLTQVKLLVPKISLKDIIKKRLIITASSILITLILIFFLNIQ